jgi:hypothetical protein
MGPPAKIDASDGTAQEKFEHNRAAPEFRRGRARVKHRDSGNNAGEKRREHHRAPDGTQNDRRREREIEKHLVVQRPAELQHRRDQRWVGCIGMGNEKERAHEIAPGKAAVPRQVWHDKEKRRGCEGEGPIKGDDPRDAPSNELRA